MVRRYIPPHARIVKNTLQYERVNRWKKSVDGKIHNVHDQERTVAALMSLAGWLGHRNLSSITMVEYFYFLTKELCVKPHAFVRQFGILKRVPEIAPYVEMFYGVLVSHDHYVPTKKGIVDSALKLRAPLHRILGIFISHNIPREEVAAAKIQDYDSTTGVLLSRYRFTGASKSALDAWVNKSFAGGLNLDAPLVYKITSPIEGIKKVRHMTPEEVTETLRLGLSGKPKLRKMIVDRNRDSERGALFYYSRKRQR